MITRAPKKTKIRTQYRETYHARVAFDPTPEGVRAVSAAITPPFSNRAPGHEVFILAEGIETRQKPGDVYEEPFPYVELRIYLR